MNHPRSGIALALVLTTACVILLIGCVYSSDEGRPNPAAHVGDAKSNRPLRVTKSTREQVLALLGQPWFVSSNGRLVGYSWTRTNYLLCSSRGTDENMVLLLGFDENDMLKSFRVSKDRPALRDEINSMLPPGQALKTPEQKT